MTIKELAEIAGCSEITVYRHIKKILPGVMREGILTDLDQRQSLEVMAALPKRNMVGDNKGDSLISNDNGPLISNDNGVMPMMAQMMKMMIVLADKVASIQTGQLQIEAPKQDYYTLVGFCSSRHIKTNFSELSGHGMKLRQMTLDAGRELRKVPDERWGHVNSYPIEILEEYFTP